MRAAGSDREQMLKIHQFAIMCAPTISQYAGVEALKTEMRMWLLCAKL